MEQLKEIVSSGDPDWHDEFLDVVESLPEDKKEDILAAFIEDVIRNRTFEFEDFKEIYEVTGEIWQTGIYLPWIELVSKYGTEPQFQIMDEDVNSDELWFALLVLDSAYQISSERVQTILRWLSDGGHGIDEILEDYVDELNDGAISHDDRDVPLILGLCTYLELDVAAQSWTQDDGVVARLIRPFLEGV